jgi:hypothetical protein
MKITQDFLEIDAHLAISWGDVKSLLVLNDQLTIVLRNGKTIQLEHLYPWTLDLAFRNFEKYLKDHPHRRVSQKKKTHSSI